MMNEQRYAVVRDGVVENVVMWGGESAWAPPEGTVLVKADDASPTDLYDGKTFTRSAPQAEPEPPAPQPTIEDILAVLPKESLDLLAARVSGWAAPGIPGGGA